MSGLFCCEFCVKDIYAQHHYLNMSAAQGVAAAIKAGCDIDSSLDKGVSDHGVSCHWWWHHPTQLLASVEWSAHCCSSDPIIVMQAIRPRALLTRGA